MDLSRSVYTRDLKITIMRALDAGATCGEVALKYQLSPKLLEAGEVSGEPKGSWPFRA